MRLFWHPQGEYLAVQVDRYTKTRKSTFTAFELFSVKERDIPMEVLARTASSGPLPLDTPRHIHAPIAWDCHPSEERACMVMSICSF